MDRAFTWCLISTLALYFLGTGYIHSDLHPVNPKLGLSPYGLMGIPNDRPPWWHWNYPR